MADKTVNRIVPKEGGKWYAIESSFDNGKTWHSSGTSSPTKEGAQKIVNNWSKGLTTDGLTKEEATAKANAAPGPKFEVAEPNKTKSVLSREEAAKAGIKTAGLPTQFQLEHPILSGSNGNVTDQKGWIDNDGNVHLNSRATEARMKAAESDKAAGRDYKTAKAPSAYDLDLRNRTLSGKHSDGTYVHDEQDLKNIIAKYGESDPELAKAAQQELNSRPKTSVASQVKKGSNLGGLTTEEWVKQMRAKGLSDEEIAAAYEKEGYSREGSKFKAAMEKYKAQDSEKETETESEKDETKDPLEKAEELEQPQSPVDIKRFSNDLNRFVIQAYLNGDFGKKSSANAIATMGFFILDKLGTALVNASQVARGMSPSAKSQWSNVLDKQTELLGNRITAEWFNSLSKTEQEALIRSGVISGTTAKTIYETVNTNAVGRAEQKDVLEISKLSQEQKGIAQSNVNALLARKSELQTLIAQLKSDQGWEAYAQAMNAVVGTAKGLSSLGVTDASSSSSQKGFSDTLSADVSAGGIVSKFVSGGVSNNSSWNNSSAEALSKSNSLNQDALALSKFKSGESYAKATREAKKAANEQLIKRLEGQIEIIDKCIDSWGKDLGL